MKIIDTLLKILCYYVSIYNICDKYEIVNISDYDYPKLDKGDIYTVAVFGTNDIHGSAFPLSIKHPITGEEYNYGGLEYLASYINTLRKEWGNRFLWIDSGDQFQGGIESKISNGTIMTDFFNAMSVNSAAIGNHEWDYGQSFLYSRLEEANFNYLAANIYNNITNKTEFLPNTRSAKIFTLGEIKVGVIGLSTIETPFTTSGDLSNIKFAAYKEIVESLSLELRKKGANAIILNSHVGMYCNLDKEAKMILKLRNSSSIQSSCQEKDEINTLLRNLDEGIVDAVIGGHTHDVVHHWVKGVPVVQSVNGGYYSNVIYLRFDKKTKKIIRESTMVEGPLPTCEKIFQNTKRCDYVTKDKALITGPLKRFSFHGVEVKKDKSVETIFLKWWNEVKKYKEVLGRTDVEMIRIKDKENLLGNFVSDGIKNATSADIAIINNGGLRSSWFPGEILVENLYNMFPFDNIVVSWEMTGSEVKRMVEIAQGGKKALYQMSGLRMDLNNNPYKLTNLKLYNNSNIEDDKTYLIGGIDFLIPFGGDDFANVISWYKTREYKEYGLLRENMINYVKKVGNIIESDYVKPDHPRINIKN